MKVGDKVKVISTPTKCNRGCGYLGNIGVVFQMDYSNRGDIYVREFNPSNLSSGCSGFRKENLRSERETIEMKILAEVYSKSNPSQKYEIRVGKDGVTYCTCWAWKKQRNCKHLNGFFEHLNKLSPDASKTIEPKTELEVKVSQAVKEAVQCLK